MLGIAVPLLLVLHGVLAAEMDKCCPLRQLGGEGELSGKYKMVKDNSEETKSYGCSTGCIYKKEDNGKMYCFKDGADAEDKSLPWDCQKGEVTPKPGGEKTTEKPSDEDELNKFCDKSKEHTMCKYIGPSKECAKKTSFRTLSKDAKQAILDKHNALRRKVAKGEEKFNNQPKAADMREMVWNDELEKVAQRWSDQCTFGHDKERKKLDGTYVGQNAYISMTTADTDETEANNQAVNSVQAWYDEVSKPGFDPVNIDPFKSSAGTGHYTQVVWGASEELGCGMVFYEEEGWKKNLIVCNYATGGNFLKRPMYTKGEPCSKCPSDYKCNDGLCVKPVVSK